MGGKSSSSNKTSTNTTNTTTTKNVSGSNAAQGDNNGVMLSGVTDSNINVQMTDHGAINKAVELGELALSHNGAALESAVDLGKEALKSNENVSIHALESTVDLSKEALKSNENVSIHALESVTESNHENLQMLAGLAGNQAAQNSRNLDALTEFATVKADGGQIETTKYITWLGVAAFGLFSVAMFATRKG